MEFKRLQSTAETILKGYIAEGEVLDLPTKSFGGIGVFAVPEMGRFYRYALLEKRFPHHTAVAFRHAGRALYDVMWMLGVEDIRPLQTNSFLAVPQIIFLI